MYVYSNTIRTAEYLVCVSVDLWNCLCSTDRVQLFCGISHRLIYLIDRKYFWQVETAFRFFWKSINAF